MKKLYEKSELTFAIVEIVITVAYTLILTRIFPKNLNLREEKVWM